MSGIYAYLESQADDLARLYASPWCSLAVFQSLDAVSKQCVLWWGVCILSPRARVHAVRTPAFRSVSTSPTRRIISRLLFFKGITLSYALFEQWFKPLPAVRRELRECVDRLLRLRILGSPVGSGVGGEQGPWRGADMNGTVETAAPLIGNGIFLAAMHEALTASRASPWRAETDALPPLASPPTRAEIEAHAAHRWNAVLHFLVGTADAPAPDAKVVELLVSTHLLAPGASAADEMLFDADGVVVGMGAEAAESGGVTAATSAQLRGKALTFDDIMELGGGDVHITRRGYEFLLKDTAVQVRSMVDIDMWWAVASRQRSPPPFSIHPHFSRLPRPSPHHSCGRSSTSTCAPRPAAAWRRRTSSRSCLSSASANPARATPWAR